MSYRRSSSIVLRFRSRPMRPLLALMLGTWVLASRAQNSGPVSDPQLASRMIDVAAHHSRPLSLAEVFALVEIETGMNVIYPPGSIVLGEEVVLEKAEKIPLSQLLASVGAQRSLVFERRDGELQVRSAKAPAPVVMEPSPRPRSAAATAVRIKTPSPAPAPVVRVSPAPASVPTAESALRPVVADQDGLISDLAAQIERIASGRGVRSRKEKDIAAAVRGAIAEVHLSVERREQVLDLAVDLVQAASGAAPQFTETIANAAVFAPAVAGLKSAGARLRAAAYAGMRAPQPRRNGVQRDELPVERAVVIKAPRGQTPETFVVPGVESVLEAAPARDSDDVAAAVRRTSSLAESVQADAPAVATAPPSDGVDRADAAPAEGARRVITLTTGPLPSDREESSAPTSLSEGVTPFSAPALELPGAATNPNPSPERGTGDVIQMERFGVSDTVVKGGSADLRAERAKATVSIDFMSADQLAKFGAADLSEVVFRIPGVSVANGQFAVVRGLSDRFLSTTLNGLKLPSPDPEKQAFQLDLLPTSAVEAVVVSKTYESNLWAESTGGAMDILTRVVPDDRRTRSSVGFKVNQTTFDGGLDYAVRSGTFKELLGFGSEVRPARGEIDRKWQYVPTYRTSMPLGSSVSLEHVDAIPIGDTRRIGLLFSIANSSSHDSESGLLHSRAAKRGANARPGAAGIPSDFEIARPMPNQLDDISDYAASSSTFSTNASLGLGYEFSREHALKFSSVWVQTGDDQSFIAETTVIKDPVTGRLSLANPQPGPPRGNFPAEYSFFRTNEYFRERNLTLFQLSGKHVLSILKAPAITWAVQRGRASQLDSPFIEAEFVTPFAEYHRTFLALGGNDAPTPITVVGAENRESQYAGKMDLKWNFRLWGKTDAEFSAGSALERSERNIAGTGLIFDKPDSSRPLTGGSPNEAVSLAAASNAFRFDSAMAANRAITAYYANLKLPLMPGVTLVGGARFEDYNLEVDGVGKWGLYTTTILYSAIPGGFGPFLGTRATGNPPYSSQKWYPGVSLKLDFIESVSLRLGYSRTDGRPSFREVSPLFNKSVFTGNLVAGNPVLRPSEATNYDVRLDWTPDRNNLLSVSYFQKAIQDPVEKYLLDTRSVAGYRTEIWVNNPVEAELRGVELEMRHGLGTWSEVLRDFSIGANYTRMEAVVPEHPVARTVAGRFFADPSKVPSTRRLYDQPEYIANLDVTWSRRSSGTRVTLAGYALSDTLATAGLQSFAFDLYERAYTSYDLIFSQTFGSRFKLTLTAKNFNDPLRGTIYDQDATAELVPAQQYRAGRNFGVSLTADF